MPALNRREKADREVIGLIPAGGLAKRIAPLPCSKELYPIGFRTVDQKGSVRPKVASHYLLEKMRRAGITKAYIVLRNGKWDIPAYLGDGSLLEMKLAYLITKSSLGPPYTLDQAYPFLGSTTVAFGFPDILFRTADAYKILLRRQLATKADVVLGLFPAPEPHKVDMVQADQDGRVRSIAIKPRRTRSPYTWLIAVWSATFSLFMHTHLGSRVEQHEPAPTLSEISLGQVFQAALAANLYFDSVAFGEDTWVDIGTPDDLIKATRRFV
jgi:glucose-1-phosphate thymidylyltransferase